MQPDPLDAVVGELELRLERAHQFVEVVGAPVDRLEDHRHAVTLLHVAGQALQRRHGGLGVARRCRAREDLGVAIDGAGRVADPVGQDLGQAQRRRVLVGPERLAIEAGVQVVGQVRPAAGLRQQALQFRCRRTVGRVDLQRLAQRADGAVGVVQLLLVELGAAAQERHAGRRIHRAPRLLVDELAQLRPSAPALERRLQELRRLAVVRPCVVEAPVQLLGLGPLSEPEVEDLGSAPNDLQDGRLLRQLAVEVVGQERRRVLPAIQLVGQAQERLAGLALGRRLLEDLAVPAERAVEVLQLLLVEARDPPGPGLALPGVLDLQQADLAYLDQ